MTANEFRKQKVGNTRLRWLIHGHKAPLEQMENFKNEELRDIYHVDERPEIRSKIIDHFFSRGLDEHDIANLL